MKENIAFPEARIKAQQASYAQVASAHPHTSDNLRPPTSHGRPAPLPQLLPAKTNCNNCLTNRRPANAPSLPPPRLQWLQEANIFHTNLDGRDGRALATRARSIST